MGRSSRTPARAVETWRRPAFAVVTPGLEAALADELADLGIEGKIEEGGVSFLADLPSLYVVHLYSRIAARVVARLGTVEALSLEQLAARLRDLPWKAHVHAGQPLEVSVTAHRSRLRHRDVVAKKVQNAVTDALRGPRLPGPRPPREPAEVQLRIVSDRATVSVDASGELLHRRGWRLATAKAPLRENLAAAVLRLADWSPGEALVDPMCGAGTFAIEAASISAGRPAGAGRAFAFERWPCFDPAAWKRLRDEAASMGPLDVDAPIWASDRDEGAVEATTANARRAGVLGRIRVRRALLSELEPPGTAGLVVMNPPYGARIGSASAHLYRDVGDTLRRRWSGWRLAVLLPGPRFKGALGFPLEQAAAFKNGGIGVVLYVGEIP